MDLNLLIALDALLEENSVLAAAERLNLTPPAVSRTLSRIREATGDDILVRSGRSMTPTPYAQAIRHEVQQVVRQARALLKPSRELDLAMLDREYTIRGHDALIAALAPRLIEVVAEKAPQMHFRFIAEEPEDGPGLLRGHVDLELGGSLPTVPEISFELLAEDRLVLAMSSKHPMATGPLTPKRFAQALHVNVSRRGRLRGPVDELLAAQGLQRRVIASLPTTAAALEVVSRGTAVALVPGAACRASAAVFGLTVRAVPLALAPSKVVMAWHRRHDSDLAHAWLRGMTGRVAKETDWSSRGAHLT